MCIYLFMYRIHAYGYMCRKHMNQCARMHDHVPRKFDSMRKPCFAWTHQPPSKEQVVVHLACGHLRLGWLGLHALQALLRHQLGWKKKCCRHREHVTCSLVLGGLEASHVTRLWVVLAGARLPWALRPWSRPRSGCLRLRWRRRWWPCTSMPATLMSRSTEVSVMVLSSLWPCWRTSPQPCGGGHY